MDTPQGVTSRQIEKELDRQAVFFTLGNNLKPLKSKSNLG
jgi:hypothetical protein